MSSAISTVPEQTVDGDLAQDRVSLDPLLFRRTCARFATGITVVTVADGSGRPHGMTVNSFSSVSLDPPLVLVSIELRNSILAHFTAESGFAINILAEHQEHLSKRFSGPAADRFHRVDWTAGLGGAPLLDGVLAHLECRVANQFPAGDHTVLIGEVLRARYEDGKPLLYFASRYAQLR